jgi:hypothetical protein
MNYPLKNEGSQKGFFLIWAGYFECN